MIEPAKLTSTFDRTDVRRLFDDADHRLVSPRIGADGAELTLGEIEAARAGTYALGERDEGLGQPPALLQRLFQEVIGEPQRGLAPNARKLRELGRQIVDSGQLERCW